MDFEARLRAAVRHFWLTRDKQAKNQGAKTGHKDAGARADVTGGAHLDGFIDLVRDLLQEAGIDKPDIYRGRSAVEIPGWFRPEKQWDLIVVSCDKLIAAIEFKAHIGPSFGNNYNNRTEEAIGNATDVLAAYREGAYKESLRPWLGYMMLLESAPGSTKPVDVSEPHFPIFPEFRGASYCKRYELTLTKLVRERLYDAACLLTTPREGGKAGDYAEPKPELSYRNFAESLLARALAHVKTSEQPHDKPD